MEKVVHVPEVMLNSGYKMPLLGMGTFNFPMPPIDELTSILVDAIKIGYRHFDTAAAYGSEEGVGRAVAEAIERGIIKSRQQMFITSKLCCTQAHPQLVLPALKNTLGKLGLDFVDLYLIHWPISMKPEIDIQNFKKEDIVPFDMKGVWQDMEECYKLGLAKSIGVSNFSCTKLSHLLQIATIPPAVNQWFELGTFMLEVSSSKSLASRKQRSFAFWVELVAPDLSSAGTVPRISNSGSLNFVQSLKKAYTRKRETLSLLAIAISKTAEKNAPACRKNKKPKVKVEMNVAWQQQKLLEFCREKGVHVSGYSPLGANGGPWGSHAVMRCPILSHIATIRRKTIPQVALRWVYEQGESVIVKSLNKERMKQNLVEIFNWELSSEDNFRIRAIPQRRGCNGEPFIHPNGPYKSIDELWDGEI
ncbi:hypothetical protein MTR67_014415 [Solanum verrucosum]|uniref:NADP-dependent oxidoreductase domain-containing protein n=1 Tax=Solanum verrucosum TaxID=315347 RepID=A0AAF0QGU1_SOLVR|nr:hypothetical protein MTR67_014415 [Solanum verrucosum]